MRLSQQARELEMSRHASIQTRPGSLSCLSLYGLGVVRRVLVFRFGSAIKSSYSLAGPVSLVFEDPFPRNSKGRSGLITRLANLRAREPSIRELVDFHIVTSLPSSNVNRTRERLITRPVASNFHLNLARFFARTDMVWLVGDSRIIPSSGLRERLSSDDVHRAVLEHGDGFVVPTFAPVRRGDAAVEPTVLDLRRDSGWEPTGVRGVGEDEFVHLAAANLARHRSSLPLEVDQWPQNKENLVRLVSPAVSDTAASADDARYAFALYDSDWEPNHGPSNWALWGKMPSDPALAAPAEEGGGEELGLAGGIGGGDSPYRIDEYDLHYSPNVVISRGGSQPWCTERFVSKKSACVYQSYLAGSELWVLSDQWAYTLEYMDKNEADENEDEFLKVRIDAPAPFLFRLVTDGPCLVLLRLRYQRDCTASSTTKFACTMLVSSSHWASGPRSARTMSRPSANEHSNNGASGYRRERAGRFIRSRLWRYRLYFFSPIFFFRWAATIGGGERKTARTLLCLLMGDFAIWGFRLKTDFDLSFLPSFLPLWPFIFPSRSFRF
jgi:hypothetical protein